MNIISKVEIIGFWDNRNISVDLHKDVNFFIGVNGSGKTTVINIIAAALSVDFSTLVRLPFRKLRIELSKAGSRKKPNIEVEKVQAADTPYLNIKYKIKEKAADQWKVYSVDVFEDGLPIRRRMLPPRHRTRRIYQTTDRGILEKLKSIVNVSWLSIHRTSPSRSREEDMGYESSVDQKLEELSNRLGRYLSALSAKVSDEATKFQQNIVSSVLTQTRVSVDSLVESFDIEEEKKALRDIFQQFKISDVNTNKKIDEHLHKVNKAREKYKKDNKSLDNADLLALLNLSQSHSAVENWKAFLKKQEEILQPKSTLVVLLNELFQGKEIIINNENEIEAITDSEKKLRIRDLSSGEKQLIIILGEALLQNKSPWIYIADEPELSLHVKWQEKLIENLNRVNPKAQIICATHSPDIVSTYTKNIFDMEEIVK